MHIHGSKVRDAVRDINATASLLEAERAEVPLEQLLDLVRANPNPNPDPNPNPNPSPSPSPNPNPSPSPSPGPSPNPNPNQVPLDVAERGVITNEVFGAVLRSLPEDSECFVVLDCCHAGSMVDLP